MRCTEDVLFVLQLLLGVGPLAVYFLGLGLANSRSRPCLISARSDFLMLAIAVVPLVIVPLAAAAEYGSWLPVAGIAGGCAAVLAAVLPRREAGWVLYNSDARQCRRLLERACRRAGWSPQWHGDRLCVPEAGLSIRLDVLPWLRNVTLRVKTSPESRSAGEILMAHLSHELDGEAMLPSATGASLVLVGAGMLSVPLWFLFDNAGAIVDAVRQLLFA